MPPARYSLSSSFFLAAYRVISRCSASLLSTLPSNRVGEPKSGDATTACVVRSCCFPRGLVQVATDSPSSVIVIACTCLSSELFACLDVAISQQYSSSQLFPCGWQSSQRGCSPLSCLLIRPWPLLLLVLLLVLLLCSCCSGFIVTCAGGLRFLFSFADRTRTPRPGPRLEEV